MRSVRDWDLSDLESLCSTKAEESSALEFKRSDSLSNTPANKEELCKDVSGMANAAGGIIVYGIAEGSRGEASHIDNGCDPSVTKPEWIDQVLTSGVEPKMVGMIITPITLKNGNRAFAIEIEQATVFAPHQVRQSKRYHKRTERRVDAMLDYEIRDMMRRRSTPDLYVQLSTRKKQDKLFLTGSTGNNSSEPALYSVLTVAFDNGLGIETLSDFEIADSGMYFTIGETKYPATMFIKKMGVPGHFPIFRETNWSLWDVEIVIPPDRKCFFFYTFACPGFTGGRTATISILNANPVIQWLPHDFSKIVR